MALVCYRVGNGHGNMAVVCGDKIHEEKLELAMEVEFSNALMSSLEWYKQNNPDLWQEEFVNTTEYQKIDSLTGGNWSSFQYPVFE